MHPNCKFDPRIGFRLQEQLGIMFLGHERRKLFLGNARAQLDFMHPVRLSDETRCSMHVARNCPQANVTIGAARTCSIVRTRNSMVRMTGGRY